MAKVEVEIGLDTAAFAKQLRQLADKLDPLTGEGEKSYTEPAGSYGFTVGDSACTYADAKSPLLINGVDVLARLSQLEADVRRLECQPARRCKWSPYNWPLTM